MKSLLLSLPALILPLLTHGQITRILIGVNGLTCSQCTRNVELKLRKLPFVADVSMNLEQTNGTLQLRPDVQISPEAVARSVKNAGFSLRYLVVVVHHPERFELSATCFSISGLNFESAAPIRDGNAEVIKLRLLGEPYQPGRKVKQQLTKTCNGYVYFVRRSDD